MSVWLRREPMLNRSRSPVGTRFVLQADTLAAAIAVLDELAADWPAAGESIVALPDLSPGEELLAWRRPTGAMFEFPAAAFATESGQSLAVRLDAAGVPLCLGGFVPVAELPAAPRFRYVLADAGTLAQPARAPGIPLATGLADNAGFAAAIDNGYEGAAGWFFLHGPAVQGRGLNPAHARIIHVLNLVRQNAELTEVEAALKQDVGIAFKLLRYINSAGFGMARKVESFRHAVTLIGYAKLNKWLSLLLVTASQDPAAAALMQTAIARGRFMEIVAAGRVAPAALDNLFIAGSFSLLDALLGSPLADVLAEMNLPDDIAAGLLQGSGPCAPWLELVMAGERGDVAEAARLATALGVDAATYNRAQLAAETFARDMRGD